MISPRLLKIALISLCVWTLSACISIHPLGMSNAEWDSLSLEQKISAREKQAQLTAQKKQNKANRLTAGRSAAASRYETARYGDIITVNIIGGTMDIHGKRREYEPIAFDLIRGESKQIEIVRKGKKYQKDTAVVRLSDDGRTFYYDDERRNRLVLVDQGWQQGKTYSIEKLKNRNTNPRGITISIIYRHRRDTSKGEDRIIIIR